MNFLSQIHLIFPITLLATLATTCLNSHSPNLSKLGQYDIKIDEPSGLALDPSGPYLWIVSDHSNKAYKTDLNGKVIHHFDTKSKDSEGIATSIDGKEIFILDESEKVVYGYTIEGEKTRTIKLDIKASDKSGPEGLDINTATSHFLIVNEKDPRILLEVDDQGIEITRKEIGFLSDLSAIAYDSESSSIWLLSDQDQKLVQVGPKNQILNTYAMDIDQMEGLAIDFRKKIIYIVSDSEEELHIFQYK